MCRATRGTLTQDEERMARDVRTAIKGAPALTAALRMVSDATIAAHTGSQIQAARQIVALGFRRLVVRRDVAAPALRVDPGSRADAALVSLHLANWEVLLAAARGSPAQPLLAVIRPTTLVLRARLSRCPQPDSHI